MSGGATASATAEFTRLGSAIDGDVVVRGSSSYESLRLPARQQPWSPRPLAIVRCRRAEDVAEALLLARRLRIPVAPRSGGHCFAGRSSSAGVVVDVSPMQTVDVAGDVAIVGAGVRLGTLYDVLDGRGCSVPAGCGETVGIAGLTLGGGLGILGRLCGLTCDRLVAAQIVLADGRIITCDGRREPDLFWALRGAGGGQFGVVTSLWLRTVPALTSTAFCVRWASAHAAAAIASWQRWAPDAPDTVDASLRITATGEADWPLSVELVGAIHESQREAERRLEELIAPLGTDPSSLTLQHGPLRAVKDLVAGVADDVTDDAAIPVTTSEVFDRDLPEGLVTALLGDLVADGSRRQMAFTPLGGAYNRMPPQATAFAHRRQRFVLEHSTSASREAVPDARAWANRAWTTAHRAGTGRVYPNFPDPQLQGAQLAYHGENLARLRSIKRRYDPEDTFRFHQSL